MQVGSRRGDVMVVLSCEKLPQIAIVLGNISFHEGNEWYFDYNSGKAFHTLIMPIKLCLSYQLYYKVLFLHVKINIYFWSCSYCKQSLLWLLLREKTYITALPKFHTHLEANSTKSFQSVFDNCLRVFKNLAFSRNWTFHEHRHSQSPENFYPSANGTETD